MDDSILKLTGEKDTTYSRRRFATMSESSSESDSELKVTMNLKDTSDNEIKEYECTVNEESSSYELSCNTSANPLNTNNQALHLSVGISSDKSLLLVEMEYSDSTDTIGDDDGPILPAVEEYVSTPDDQQKVEIQQQKMLKYRQLNQFQSRGMLMIIKLLQFIL